MQAKALMSSLLTRPGRTVTFEWTESFDFDCVVFLQGTFTDWIDVPMTRTKGTHVFAVTYAPPRHTHCCSEQQTHIMGNGSQRHTLCAPAHGRDGATLPIQSCQVLSQ